MEKTSSRFCILLLTLSATLRVAHLQLPIPSPQIEYGCTLPTMAELGRTDIESQEGFVSSSLAIGDITTRPSVRILNVNFVCGASGATRTTLSRVSFVVQFTCSGVALCDNADSFTEQFQFDCTVEGTTFTPTKVVGSVRTANPLATLDTTFTNQCGDCSEESINGVLSNNVTHCVACQEECVGLRKCLGVLPGQCCNYYENDVCIVNCTAPLTPDDQFDCGCGDLMVPNADVSFSNRFLIGSVATQRCDAGAGFVPSGAASEVTRPCTTGGWDGEDIICQRFKCPNFDLVTSRAGSFVTDPVNEPHYVGTVATFSCDSGYVVVGMPTRTCELITGWTGENPGCRALCSVDELTVQNGMFEIDPPASDAGSASVGAVATFTCVEGFEVQGDPRECTVDGWSGANPTCGSTQASSGSACGVGCIVGIVLAILGVIILAAILAGVAYAVYSYLNHPDTKLAKYDPDNINGVAKDNPLYVDPEAVVGDGAEAA